jgi:hypothetical protein
MVRGWLVAQAGAVQSRQLLFVSEHIYAHMHRYMRMRDTVIEGLGFRNIPEAVVRRGHAECHDTTLQRPTRRPSLPTPDATQRTFV